MQLFQVSLLRVDFQKAIGHANARTGSGAADLQRMRETGPVAPLPKVGGFL